MENYQQQHIIFTFLKYVRMLAFQTKTKKIVWRETLTG